MPAKELSADNSSLATGVMLKKPRLPVARKLCTDSELGRVFYTDRVTVMKFPG